MQKKPVRVPLEQRLMFKLDPSLAPVLEAQGLVVNPPMAFLDVLAKGYGVVEADAQERRVTYRSQESVLVPESSTRIGCGSG